MPKHFAAIVYQVQFRDGEPANPRPELGETLPCYADMLRYDLGFHSPSAPTLVIFPFFRHKSEGDYPADLTVARWRSFGVKLDEVPQVDPIHEDEWVTYQHPEEQDGRIDYSRLAPVTLRDWLKAHPKVVKKGWRILPPHMPSRYWAVTG